MATTAALSKETDEVPLYAAISCSKARCLQGKYRKRNFISSRKILVFKKQEETCQALHDNRVTTAQYALVLLLQVTWCLYVRLLLTYSTTSPLLQS
jgi:hypothetical protein